MKNIQLFKDFFSKSLPNKQYLLNKSSFGSRKYYAFSLPKRYCYRFYRFSRNLKRLIFFKKQFYVKATKFNIQKVNFYQSHINFFNKINFFFINFFFDWNHTFKLKFYFRNFTMLSFFNKISYYDDIDDEIFNLLQKNAVQIYFLNKSFLIYRFNKTAFTFKNKIFNIKNLTKLKIFFSFLIYF